jgi:hypothetical protein
MDLRYLCDPDEVRKVLKESIGLGASQALKSLSRLHTPFRWRKIRSWTFCSSSPRISSTFVLPLPLSSVAVPFRGVLLLLVSEFRVRTHLSISLMQYSEISGRCAVVKKYLMV